MLACGVGMRSAEARGAGSERGKGRGGGRVQPKAGVTILCPMPAGRGRSARRGRRARRAAAWQRPRSTPASPRTRCCRCRPALTVRSPRPGTLYALVAASEMLSRDISADCKATNCDLISVIIYRYDNLRSLQNSHLRVRSPSIFFAVSGMVYRGNKINST